MAEENSASLDSYAYTDASAGMEKYRETAVAFDNLIAQVGRAIAAAQQSMDENQILFQRQVAKAVKEGKLRRLEVPPINAYSMPETTLNLKMGLSIDYSEESKGPALSAVPLNATTTNQNDIDIESATEIKLRFVSVPQSQEPPGPAPSSLTPEKVQEIVEQDDRVAPLLEELEKCTLDVDYKEDTRLWVIAYLEAREARLVVLVDDRTAEVPEVIDKKFPPTDAELKPIAAPVFYKIEPFEGKQGEILTIYGDNFLTLAGQTTLLVDNRPIPMVRFSMKSISFKVPGWTISGDVKITTPLGSVWKDEAFIPIPTVDRFSPARGFFDALHLKGSWLAVYGHNLRPGCTIEFATAARARDARFLSPGQMEVEVPEGAGTGPLTLVFGDHRQSLGELFFMLPLIQQLTPRQARVGEEVTLSGNSLANVSDIVLGDCPVSSRQFTLHTPTQIRFQVPPEAGDGRIRLREFLSGPDEYNEVSTADIFYVVPRIIGFGSQVGLPGVLLNIYGEGLDPDVEMMSLIFDAKGGISEAPVLAVSPDRKHITTRVPEDAVSGFVLLLRKTVYNHESPMDTSDLSRNKLTVLKPGGDVSDLLLDERFDEEELSCWTPEAGTWYIDQGMLAAQPGAARLSLNDPLETGEEKIFPLEQFSIYADIIGAERFGFSFVPAGGSTYLQAWVDLVSDYPALTWSKIDTKGKQIPLQEQLLAVSSGGNHLVQLNVKKSQSEENQGLELTFLIDQEEVQTFYWDILRVGSIALLSDSSSQRWDNVIILKGEYLSLQDPGLYRFGTIPELPELTPLSIDMFEPRKGTPGAQVTLTGEGFDAALRVFFGGVEAVVLETDGSQAIVEVPVGAMTGPIEARSRGGVVVTTGRQWFILPPTIIQIAPERVLTGQELRILGTNLPTEPDNFTINILGQTALVSAATPSMLTVLVPDVLGEGKVSLEYEGFEAEAPTLLEVRREEVLLDLVDRAENAAWMSSAGGVRFGVLNEAGEPSIQMRTSERLEDDRVYGPVLYVHPPAPDLRALCGVYPEVEVPLGRIELRIEFGMLWTAAPAAEEAADVDGVMFEVSFKFAETGEEVVLLPRTTCVHDGSLERFVVDASSIAGKKGQPVLSIFAGRTGLRDDAAIISGKIMQLI